MSDDEREATWSRCRSRRGGDGDAKSRTRRPYYVAHYLAPPPTPPPLPSSSPSITRSASIVTASPSARSSSPSAPPGVDTKPERTSWFRWWRRGRHDRSIAAAQVSSAAGSDATRTASPESPDRRRRLADRPGPPTSPPLAAPPSSLAPARLPSPPSPPLSSETSRSSAVDLAEPMPATVAVNDAAERKNVTEPEAHESATTAAAAEDDDGSGGDDGDGVAETRRATPRKRTKKSAGGGERKRGREERTPTEPRHDVVVAQGRKMSRTRCAEVGDADSSASVVERKIRPLPPPTPPHRGAAAKPTKVASQKKRKTRATAAAAGTRRDGSRPRVGARAGRGRRDTSGNALPKVHVAEEEEEEEEEEEDAKETEDGQGREPSGDERDQEFAANLEEEGEEEGEDGSESELEKKDASSESLPRRGKSRRETSDADREHEDEATGQKGFDPNRVPRDVAELARLPDRRRRPQKSPTTSPPPRGCLRRCVGRTCCCCCGSRSSTTSLRSRVCWSIAIGTLAALAVVALAVLAHHWRHGRNWVEARRDMSEWDAQDVRRVAAVGVNDAVQATAEKLERATASVRAVWVSSLYGAGAGVAATPDPIPFAARGPSDPPPAPTRTERDVTAGALEFAPPPPPIFPSSSDFRPVSPLSEPTAGAPLSSLSASRSPSAPESETVVVAIRSLGERDPSDLGPLSRSPTVAEAAATTAVAASVTTTDPVATPSSDVNRDPAVAARQRFGWRQRVRLSDELSPNHRTAGSLVLLSALFIAMRTATAVARRRARSAAASSSSAAASDAPLDAPTCMQCASTDASLKSLAQLVRVDRIHVASAPVSVAAGTTLAHACRDARLAMRMWEWLVRRRRRRPRDRGDSRRPEAFGVELHLAATDASVLSAVIERSDGSGARDNTILYDADARRAQVTWHVGTERTGATEIDDDGDARFESRPWRALDIASALVRLESQSVAATVALPADAGDRQWWCVEQWVDVVFAPLLRELSASRDDGDGDGRVGNRRLVAVHVRAPTSNPEAIVFQCTHRESSPPLTIKSPRVEIPCDQLTDTLAVEALRRLFAGHV